MSQMRQSKATVVRVKGVSFNYLQFLWNSIGQIRQQQAQQNYSGAMTLVAELIPYLPNSIKEDFRDKASHINMIMNAINSGNVLEIQNVPDLFIRGIFRKRVLQQYSYEAFGVFIDDLTTRLNELGYLENLKVVKEGEADEQFDWIAEDKKRKRTQKKKEKSRSPQGTMD